MAGGPAARAAHRAGRALGARGARGRGGATLLVAALALAPAAPAGAQRQGEHACALAVERAARAGHPPSAGGAPCPALAARAPRPPDPGAPPAFVLRRGCARETVARIAAVVSWLRTLPLGDAWGALAERELGGRC